MFKRIVVPVDLTERNRGTVEMAARLAGSDGTVFLLHVIETIPGMSLEEESTFFGKLEDSASEYLAELGKLLEGASFTDIGNAREPRRRATIA